jgi:succinate dehydrogenase / fumarate reductase cytochrome b subunit
VSYARKDHRVASYAGRTMVWSGIIVFGFIAFHLAHYTLYLVTPEYKNLHDSLGRHDVYAMVVHGFSNVGLSVLYIISVGLLCAHLSHGIPSFFQSLGLRHPKYTPAIEASGPIIAVLLFLGYAAVPVGVMAKWVTLAGGAS